VRNPADMLVIERIARAIAHSGRRQGAGHHPAAGSSDRTHVDSISD
jgi:hypothetical protein